MLQYHNLIPPAATTGGIFYLGLLCIFADVKNTNGYMSEKDTDIVYFISFCLEQYKIYKQLSGTEVSELFDQYHVYDYLADNYDVLHTQGHQWLNLDIDQFIKEQK